MSARRDKSQDVCRCKCGELPGVSVQHAGRVRLYSIECRCGHRTGKSERPEDVVFEWAELNPPPTPQIPPLPV